MKNSNDAFRDDAYNEESKLYSEFMSDVKRHDYSYMMSDDHKIYMNGRGVEKQIQEKLHALIGICKYDASDLLDEVLTEVKQEYNDRDENGNDLTHRVIRGWFKPYYAELYDNNEKKLFTLNNDR